MQYLMISSLTQNQEERIRALYSPQNSVLDICGCYSLGLGVEACAEWPIHGSRIFIIRYITSARAVSGDCRPSPAVRQRSGGDVKKERDVMHNAPVWVGEVHATRFPLLMQHRNTVSFGISCCSKSDIKSLKEVVQVHNYIHSTKP